MASDTPFRSRRLSLGSRRPSSGRLLLRRRHGDLHKRLWRRSRIDARLHDVSMSTRIAHHPLQFYNSHAVPSQTKFSSSQDEAALEDKTLRDFRQAESALYDS